MDEIRKLLDESQLRALRDAYAPEGLVRCATAQAEAHPPLKAWCDAIHQTFYESNSLAPKDRERCLIGLLTSTGPPVSLGIHVYWGLMEGLSLDEILQTISLTGCYAGLPACGRGMMVVQQVAELLQEAAAEGHGPDQVLEALMKRLGLAQG